MKFVSKIFVLAFFALACTACGDSGLVVDTSDATMDFSPQDLTINVGDTVTFKMTVTHNAVEVSKDIYDQVVGGGLSERLEGGFVVDFGETKDITFDQPGVHYFVCEPHITVGMYGTITVQ